MKKTNHLTQRIRILAIEPFSRGFGFVVLEGPDTLLDWGIKNTPKDKRKSTLLKVADLVRLYDPTVVVLEDCFAKESRRNPRVRELLSAITELAINQEVPVKHYSKRQTMDAFAPCKVKTRYGIARAIARDFSELGPSLPPPRRPWMSEDPRMRIFDALSLAVAYGCHMNHAQ